MELNAQALSISAEVLAQSVVLGDRLMLPAAVNAETFKQLYQAEIESPLFTEEKALYLCISSPREPMISLSKLLLRHAVY